jgi:hypothetical protein
MFHTGRTNSTVNEFPFIRSRIEDAIGLSDGDVAFLWRYRNRLAMCGKAAEIRGVSACGRAPAAGLGSPLLPCEQGWRLRARRGAAIRGLRAALPYARGLRFREDGITLSAAKRGRVRDLSR